MMPESAADPTAAELQLKADAEKAKTQLLAEIKQFNVEDENAGAVDE